MRVLLILPAIFGIALCRNSGEVYAGYDPLRGPPQGPNGPAVQQQHGAVGDPVGAMAGIEGGNSGNQIIDLPQGPHGPEVVQQHGYNGAPQVNWGTGGSSGNNQGAAQNSPQASPQGTGGNSQGNDAYGGQFNNYNPPIIPYGGDSQDQDYNNGAMYGNIPPQSGNQQAGNNFGGFGGGGNPGGSSDTGNQASGGGVYANPSRGDTNNAAPNAAPVAGGAEIGVMSHQNYEAASSGMSGVAVAGVVAGVVAVGAVGTAVAVVVLKSSASTASPA